MPPPPRAALADLAAVVPAGGGGELNPGGTGSTCHCGVRGWLALFVACLPCLSFCFCPLSPQPPSPAGKGENQSFLMQGASPLASPALDRLRHLQSLPLWCPQGGLPSLSPVAPLPLPSFLPPIPPTPFPGGEGGESKFSYARGFAPCIPATEPTRHLLDLPRPCPRRGACPGGTGSTCHPYPRRGCTFGVASSAQNR